MTPGFEIMPNAAPHRILFVDAYDSFSNNIVSLLETELDVGVTVIKIDATIEDFGAFVQAFSAVVAGPGPGHPASSADVGLFDKLWKFDGDDLVPVLGICLGFQSLVHSLGGSVEPLPEPRHGIPRTIRCSGNSIFRGYEAIETIQYHSLHASLEPAVRIRQHIGYHNPEYRESSKALSGLIPLAWDCADDNSESAKMNPLAILMAVAHLTKPFYGIQFHPESICSSASARAVIANWWHEVLVWRDQKRPTPLPVIDPPAVPDGPNMEAVARLTQNEIQDIGLNNVRYLGDRDTKRFRLGQSLPTPPTTPKEFRQVTTRVIEANRMTIPSICEVLGATDKELVVLDSEMYQREDVGTHSIVGIIAPNSLRLEYYVSANHVIQRSGKTTSVVSLNSSGESIFDYLQAFITEHKAVGGDASIPFWGGLMGYITYEACLDTIGIKSEPKSRGPCEADLSFVLVERSIVISHQTNNITVQSIKESDGGWVSALTNLLLSSNTSDSLEITESRSYSPSFSSAISYPDKAVYKSAIRSCQEEIRKGNAYELCLTSKAYITTDPPRLPSWPLYLRLRTVNRAPFSAYLSLGSLTLLSSSPERFLRWSRPQPCSHRGGGEAIRCQFRPIKGTVKKACDHAGSPDVTLAEATALLSTPKERAENLMIVDLIRHDLHGVVGSGRVTVPKLMVVEEYETLYQLVTVIEGELILDENYTPRARRAIGQKDDGLKCIPRPNAEKSERAVKPLIATISEVDDSTMENTLLDPPDQERPKSGIDILAASLPPGSMSGAPKRRACQILRSLEDQKPRGVYSGVVGYLDVGGGGDFSVVIRSAVRWDETSEKSKTDSFATEKWERGTDSLDTELPTSTGDKETGVHHDTQGAEWTVGAGGAVTSLSTEDGELEEMMTKLRSTLRVFESS